MACGCSKNKGNTAAVNKVTAPTRPSRPLSECICFIRTKQQPRRL